MSNMLRNHHRNGGDFGCCDHCARGAALHMKPGPRERHQARQREKREWKRDMRSEQ